MTIFIIAIGIVLLVICGSILFDTDAITRTARECAAAGNHRYCTSKSPWHPPGVPYGGGER